MKLWDFRKFQNDPLLSLTFSEIIHNNKHLSASAFFSPKTGNFILTTTPDHSLRIFDCRLKLSGKRPSSLEMLENFKHHLKQHGYQILMSLLLLNPGKNQEG